MSFILFLIPMLFIFTNVYAYTIQFRWTPNPPTPLDGYLPHFEIHEGIGAEEPYNDIGLNNDTAKEIHKTVAHNPDITVFPTREEGVAYMQITGVDPSKAYSFALTAYADIICTPDASRTKLREDDSPYCESLYTPQCLCLSNQYLLY